MPILQRLLRQPLLRRWALRAKANLLAAEPSVVVPEITPLQARPTDSKNQAPRLNLLIPSLETKHVFGGIWTALQLFLALKPPSLNARIILTDLASYQETPPDILKDWQVRTAEAEDSDGCYIIPFGNRAGQTIPVRAHDLFLATAWWSAYTAQRLIDWQIQHFQLEQPLPPLMYLIQDYEPGFYPWSSRYLLAQSTYQSDHPTIGIFNTQLLYDYFNRQGHHYPESYTFEPSLNPQLAAYLNPDYAGRWTKKRQLIVYGRPGVARNAFELVYLGLRYWLETDIEARDWEIISIGEPHSDLPLTHGKKLLSRGKLSLEQYAQILAESSLGVSLMCSPHPSYPPLEMAAFGVQAITNHFGNKDLSPLSENLHSLSAVTPEHLAQKLQQLATVCCQNNPANALNLGASRLFAPPETNFPFIPLLQKRLGLTG